MTDRSRSSAGRICKFSAILGCKDFHLGIFYKRINWRKKGATYSRQQTCPILVTKNCVPYWDQQTFRKIREISADFMSPIVVSTNFFSVLYWSQKTQNKKIIDICCKIIQTSCNIGMNSEFFHFLHMLHKGPPFSYTETLGAFIGEHFSFRKSTHDPTQLNLLLAKRWISQRANKKF